MIKIKILNKNLDIMKRLKKLKKFSSTFGIYFCGRATDILGAYLLYKEPGFGTNAEISIIKDFVKDYGIEKGILLGEAHINLWLLPLFIPYFITASLEKIYKKSYVGVSKSMYELSIRSLGIISLYAGMRSLFELYKIKMYNALNFSSIRYVFELPVFFAFSYFLFKYSKKVVEKPVKKLIKYLKVRE